MLGKKPNKVYDPHLKTGLGYENPKRLKKAIEVQLRMYDNEKLKNNKLKVDLPVYEETLEDVEKSRLKMKDKMIPLDYSKLNALYESFVPQMEIYVEQTYYSSSSTFNVSHASTLMANTQTAFHPDQPSHITYMQHPQPNNNYVRQPPFSTNYMQQPMQNPKDISDPITAIDMTLLLMTKAYKLNNTTPTINNQRSSSNPHNRLIAQLARAEGNGNGNNENQIRCYNYQGIVQKEEAWIQLNSEEFGFMAAAGAYDEIEEVSVNCSLKDNLQQVSTSEQYPATVEQTRAYFQSLYNNLAQEVEKVNMVNRKMKETNADLTTELC
uniref:Gag-Pol polyprotein n=1 Tax=Tanacetum cinerariifolium TaxID=118510 RepID=A0A6L2M990_TANCI|nr:hypothetical protein [Tanacetum cinerariifolium]